MKSEIYDRAIWEQKALCARHGAEYLQPSLASKLGISAEALKGILPMHGLRHRPEGDTSGWYVWSGDYSEHPDFFDALHVEHALSEPTVFAPYLGLAPGWRFLIGEDGYEDVWFDPSLLDE